MPRAKLRESLHEADPDSVAFASVEELVSETGMPEEEAKRVVEGDVAHLHDDISSSLELITQETVELLKTKTLREKMENVSSETTTAFTDQFLTYLSKAASHRLPGAEAKLEQTKRLGLSFLVEMNSLEIQRIRDQQEAIQRLLDLSPMERNRTLLSLVSQKQAELSARLTSFKKQLAVLNRWLADWEYEEQKEQADQEQEELGSESEDLGSPYGPTSPWNKPEAIITAEALQGTKGYYSHPLPNPWRPATQRNASGVRHPAAGLEQGEAPAGLDSVLEPEVLGRGIREAAKGGQPFAVLIHPGLLPAEAGLESVDRQVWLIGAAGNMRAATGLEGLELDLLSEKAGYEQRGYRVIEVLPQAGLEGERLSLPAVPVVVAQALASGLEQFFVDVTLYRAGLESLTFPEALEWISEAVRSQA